MRAARLARAVLRTVGAGVDVGVVAKDGQEAMAALLARAADRRLVPWLQRGAVQWAAAFLDAALLDELLAEPLLCSFEAALATKAPARAAASIRARRFGLSIIPSFAVSVRRCDG